MLQKGVFYFCFHYFTKTHTNFDTQKHMCVGNGVNILEFGIVLHVHPSLES